MWSILGGNTLAIRRVKYGACSVCAETGSIYNSTKQRYDKGENFISIAIIIIVGMPLWLPVLFLAVDKYYFTPARNMEINWNIEIPSNFNQIYHATSDDIYAKADGYTVYEMSEPPNTFLERFAFRKQTSIENYVKDIAIRLSVPKDHQFAFEQPYYYFQESSGEDRLVIIYFPEIKQCIFVESFSWDD